MPIVNPELQYRTPRAYVQFIGESDEVYNLSPDNILGVQTSKSLSNPAGSFEIVFKGGTGKTSQSTTGLTANSENSLDWWMARLHPMTLVILTIGAQNDLELVERKLSPFNPSPGMRRPETPPPLPKDFMASLTPTERNQLDRSIVMIGLVEECTLNVTMTPTGPQRAIRVVGRDMGKLLLDDNLTRLARAQTVTREQEIRMITVGDVGDDEWLRFMDRASINGTANSMFWKSLSTLGSDAKIPLLEALTNIVARAPSYNVQLSDTRRLQDYFDVGFVGTISESQADLSTSRVLMGEDLKQMAVRATMLLFTYQGPIHTALAYFAPPPLAELFVETRGLEARLIVRRPPFYRPGTMPGMVQAMRDYLTQAQRPEVIGRDGVQTIIDGLSPYIGDTDEFVTSDPAGRQGVRGICHTIPAFQVITYAVSRSMAGAVSVYQIYPTILMRGEASDSALQQGASASYLYDLKAAQRYGTTKTYRFGCPWDPMSVGRRRAVKAANEVTYDASQMPVLLRPEVGSREINLAMAETMRQYYYNRDNPGFLSGQIVVVGYADYRIGDRVHLPDHDDTVFYVESVQHSYQYGRSYLTTLTVSHGQPYTPPNRRLVPYEDSLTPSVLKRGSRGARSPRRNPNATGPQNSGPNK